MVGGGVRVVGGGSGRSRSSLIALSESPARVAKRQVPPLLDEARTPQCCPDHRLGVGVVLAGDPRRRPVIDGWAEDGDGGAGTHFDAGRRAINEQGAIWRSATGNACGIRSSHSHASLLPLPLPLLPLPVPLLPLKLRPATSYSSLSLVLSAHRYSALIPTHLSHSHPAADACISQTAPPPAVAKSRRTD